MIFAGLSSLIFSLAAVGIMTAAAVIIPFTLFKMSDAMIGPQATAGAKPIPRMAGAASSLTDPFVKRLVLVRRSSLFI